MNFKSFFWALITLLVFKSDFSIASAEDNRSLQSSNYPTNLDKINLFDGSKLSGQLIQLDNNRNLLWKNDSIIGKINFDFDSVSNIFLNRSDTNLTTLNKAKKSIRLHLTNGDQFLASLKKISETEIMTDTEFNGLINLPIQAVEKIEFLPSSYSILYDSSQGLTEWKKSNSKSWDIEESDLVSVFSGSTGRTLPKKDALEIRFKAEWERSFYLAIRMFSDSDGSNYGNIGYHLSFSNNRMNLQVNRRVKGRIVRETLGSLMLNEMMQKKEAKFHILAHRNKKQFVISVNNQLVARWKDSSQDFVPDGNGILLINQGGNSYIRLKELYLAGWNGFHFPTETQNKKSSEDTHYIIFNNDDSTAISSIKGDNETISIVSPRGVFDFPPQRLREIQFKKPVSKNILFKANEFIVLKQSFGQLSCKMNTIENDKLFVEHPLIGKLTIPLYFLKSIKCNLNILDAKKYINAIHLASEALNNQTPLIAQQVLEKQDKSLRSWNWKRLMFLAENMIAKETLSFTPYPEKILAHTEFAGNEDTILTTSKNGTYTLWNGHAKLANGSFSNPGKTFLEFGRMKNEAQRGVRITYPFWLSETEITQTQFDLITKPNSKSVKDSSFPVVSNWFEANDFCNLLNQKKKTPAGYTWRLPTEAEWEKACRADSKGPFFGFSEEGIQIDENNYLTHLNKFGWFDHNSDGQIKSVKQKLPNSLGLYDMHGNVWEWCLDATGQEKSTLLSNRFPGQINPFSKNGEWKILRGGAYNVEFSRCRSAYRGANSPKVVEGDRGFRLALGPDLNSDLNFTKPPLKEILYPDLGLKLLPVEGGEFLMGSPSRLTLPKAITRTFGDKLITGSIEGILGISDFSGEQIKEIYEFNSSITSLAYSKVEQIIIVGCENGEIHLVKSDTHSLIKSIRKHKFAITCIDISHQSNQFCSSSLDGQIICHSMKNNVEEWRIQSSYYNASFDFIEYNQAGNLLLTSGIGSVPKLFDTKKGKEIKLKSFPYRNLVRSRFLKNENSFISLTQDGVLVFTEVNQGLVYKIIKTNMNEVTDFSISPYGQKILIQAESGLCSIRMSPNNNGIIIKSPNEKITCSPDFFFALANKSEPIEKNLQDFLKQNGIQKTNILNRSGCRISPDNKLVVTTLDGSLRLWSRETGLWITTLGDDFVSPFIDCAFSPDGSLVIALLKSKEYLIYPSEEKTFINIYEEEKFKDLSKWF